jgi:hypothetical protein
VARLAADLGLPPPATPSVSVLLASRRASCVEDAVARIDRQSHPRLEIIVALHGESFPGDIGTRLRARTTRPLQVLRVSGDRQLGDVLNVATEAASWTLVTKMDDDDLYDRHHLEDLIDALRWSGATTIPLSDHDTSH